MIAFFPGFRHGFQAFGKGVTTVMNVILTSLLYFTILGPTSIIGRLAKKDFLSTGKKDASTYWEDLNLKTRKKEEYYSQY